MARTCNKMIVLINNAFGGLLSFVFYIKSSQWKVNDQNNYLNVLLKIISFMKYVTLHIQLKFLGMGIMEVICVRLRGKTPCIFFV